MESCKVELDLLDEEKISVRGSKPSWDTLYKAAAALVEQLEGLEEAQTTRS